MKAIEGKSGVKATVICDSISPEGVRLTTMELEYWRGIHSEFMAHRQFSRNAASSRAIPFEKMVKQLNGRPVRFGAANRGMQDTGVEHSEWVMGFPQEYNGNIGSPAYSPQEAWDEAKEHATYFAKQFYRAGYHKQVYNRLTEPFQMIKVVASATDWANFFHLRLDAAADPSIQELARCKKQAMDESVPQELSAGEWHLPYVGTARDHGEKIYFLGDISDQKWLSVEEAIKVSAARCAAVSFRNEEYSLEKCLEVYERLVGFERVHASALEHQATPMQSYRDSFDPREWEDGVTHVDASGTLFSGNFRGWVQHRQTVSNHVKK